MKYNKDNFNWGPGIFLIAYHLILLITLPFYFIYHSVHLGTVISSIVLLYLAGLSITGGYHRYYSHRAYKTNRFVEAVLLFFGSMAGQGSVLRWSNDHRIHHAHVDTDADPYSINKGFWYAHMLWLFEKPKPIDPKIVPDLMANKMVMFQHRFFGTMMVVTNFLAYLCVGWLFNDYWGAFFLAVWVRFFALHHFTWFINSLAHTWGEKPFSEEHSAVDNYILSMLTFGEGYHNYHHTYANDYRNGTRWYHFDPTKWMIWTLSKLGLAHGLKRTDVYQVKKRMVLERKDLLMDRLKDFWDEKKVELEREVQQLSDRILEKMTTFNQIKEKYIQFKKECAEKELLKATKKELKFLKKSIRNEWRNWSNLNRYIRKRAP
jgi:stearoyl-CoA desaturase (Delta-9 desaturase)